LPRRAPSQPEFIRTHHHEYNAQLQRGQPSALAVFEYAHCLIRSAKQQEVKLGVKLFESKCCSDDAQVARACVGLLRRDEEDVTRRECLFYTAMGYARLKDYERALQFIDIVCMDEPNNMQVLSLKKCIEKRQRKGTHVAVRACACEQTRLSVAPFWAARRW
jgi:fission 1 protein